MRYLYGEPFFGWYKCSLDLMYFICITYFNDEQINKKQLNEIS